MSLRDEWAQQVAKRDTADVLRAIGLETGRIRSFGPCPACKAERRSATDARLPIGLDPRSPRWKCWACDAGGDNLDAIAASLGRGSTRGLDAAGWAQVRAESERLGLCVGAVPHRASAGTGTAPRTAPAPAPAPPQGRGPFAWRDTLVADCERALREDPDAEPARRYLREARKLFDATIAEHRLGACVVRGGRAPEVWVAIPLLDPDGAAVNVKFRAVPATCPRCLGTGCDRCAWTDKAGAKHHGAFPGGRVPKYLACAGRPMPLYGAHRLGDDLSAEVIVCEGELDVVALWQLGMVRDVVSGTAGAKTFAAKDDWLDQLEPYAGFVLLFDPDSSGDDGATALAEKLGVERCSRARVPVPHKDPSDCVVAGTDAQAVRDAVARAKPMLKQEVVRAGHFAAQIEALIADPAALRGTPTGLASLDEILGGIHPGLVVVSGETKHGKTTLCTWLVREQALRGVPCMVFPLEQSPIGTQMKWLRMEVGGDFTRVTAEDRAQAAARLDALPLWNLNYRGHLGIKDVLSVLRYERRRHGLRVALLDHLGFVQDPDAEDERRDIQSIVRTLSHFGEHEGITLLLVAHPSNSHVMTGDRVRMGNLRGSSSIRQDSHVVLIVEKARREEGRVYPATNLHLEAARSDFAISGASVRVAYDPLSCVFADRWEDTPSGRAGRTVVIPDEVRHTRPRRKKVTGRTRGPGTTDDPDQPGGEA